jgi:hypothetical protein
MPTTRKHTPPTPRSLQEWMDRNGVTARGLIKLVQQTTGHSISESMMSFILRGSRRCSQMNALALHTVTKVPMRALTKWPRSSDSDKNSGERQTSVA